MSVVDRIRAALSGETNRVQSSPNERSEPSSQSQRSGESGQSERDEQSEGSERSEQLETRLYRCDPCDTTYVSDELDSCSQCDAPVEQIPTERDLGLV